MRQVAPAVSPDFVAVEVLDQGSAHGNVDDLLAAADPQHGQASIPRLREKPELCVVELLVDPPQLGVWRFAVAGGINVPSAGQQKAVDLGQACRACGVDGVPVGDVVVIADQGAGRDSDSGPAVLEHGYATRLLAIEVGLSRTYQIGLRGGEL